MTRYAMAIDYGTSYTSAALLGESGRAESLEVDGERRLASGVFLNEHGVLIAGRPALTQIALYPERAARTPKREVGIVDKVTLGDQQVPVVDMIAVVLSRFLDQARRLHEGEAPTRVTLTHPAGWHDARLAILVEAAAAAGISEPGLIPEPIGAALHFADERVTPGSYVAVYDLGGGTFDTAVLLRTDEGFEVAGPPGGDGALGGERFDDLLVDHVLGKLAERDRNAVTLLEGPGADRRRVAAFREAIRLAKEDLSDYNDVLVPFQAEIEDLPLSKPELELIVRQLIDHSVDLLLQTVSDAGMEIQDLAAVYLAGGSSRIPLVSEVVQSRLGMKPTSYGEPKCVVSLGAVLGDRLTAGDASGGDVAALMHRTGEIAGAAGLAEMSAQLLRESKSAGATATTIVVVGETKRGKSSLINALLEAPHLLPVDADVATSVHLEVTYGRTPSAVVIDHEGRQTDIPVGDIARYASTQGDRALVARTSSVLVAIPHPLLEQGFSILDTPGVGGLEAGHTEIALAALRTADALLFVTDSSSPITAPELGFLEKASERIDTVLFALTKTDQYRTWRTIRDENAGLIAEHAPRFSSSQVFPLSSRVMSTATELRAEGAEEDATHMAAASGYTDLDTALRTHIIGRSRTLRSLNLLRAAMSVLERAIAAENVRRRSAQGDPTLFDELRAEQVRYEAFQSNSSSWKAGLQTGLSGVRAAMHAQVEAGARLADAYETRATAGEDAEELLGDMFNAYRGRWVDVQHVTRAQILDVLDTVCAQFRREGIELVSDELGVPQRVGEMDVDGARAQALAVMSSAFRVTPPSTKTGTTWGDAWKEMSGTSKVVAASVSWFLFWPALPALWAWTKYRHGKQQPGAAGPQPDARAALVEAIREASGSVIEGMHRDLDQLVDVIERSLREELERRVEHRRQDFAVAVAAHRDRLHQSEESRFREAADAQSNIAAAARLTTRIEKRLAELRHSLKEDDAK